MTPKPAAPTANGAPVPAPPPPPAAAERGLPPALSGPPGVDTVLNVLRRYGLLIGVVGVGVGLLAAFAVWAVLPGRYASTTKLQLTGRLRAAEGEDPAANQKAQLAVLKSDPVLRKAVQSPNVAMLLGGR